MTLTERVKALEEEVKVLREQLAAHPNAHDYSGTTSGSAERAGRPPSPFGFGRHVGEGSPPEVTAHVEPDS